MGSYTDVKNFIVLSIILFVILCASAIFALHNVFPTPICRGTVRCETTGTYKFTKGQGVIGEEIVLYSEEEITLRQCYIHDGQTQFDGEVRNGVVNPANKDITDSNYPPCSMPEN